MKEKQLSQIREFVREFLLHQKPQTSEYEIISELNRQGFFEELRSTQSTLVLFQKHFLTMNCLYSLQDLLYEQGYHLAVDPIRVSLHKLENPSDSATLSTDNQQFLKDYYLNLDHFHKTTGENVAEMMDRFWQKFLSYQNSDSALEVLGVSHDATWQEVQTAYRLKVQQEHPDKGGRAEVFQEIQAAYETLKKRFS